MKNYINQQVEKQVEYVLNSKLEKLLEFTKTQSVTLEDSLSSSLKDMENSKDQTEELKEDKQESNDSNSADSQLYTESRGIPQSRSHFDGDAIFSRIMSALQSEEMAQNSIKYLDGTLSRTTDKLNTLISNLEFYFKNNSGNSYQKMILRIRLLFLIRK